MRTTNVVLWGGTLLLSACGSDLTVGEEPVAGAAGMATGGGAASSSGGTGGDGAMGGSAAAGDAGTGGSGTGGSGTGGSGTGGSGTGGSGTGGSGTSGAAQRPCDVLSRSGHACVSAHSTVRALVGGYDGNLYRVQRTDLETADIGVMDGVADAAAQETFCAGSSCTITVIYDQSGRGNDLTPAPPGGARPISGAPAVAGELRVSIQGRSVYGVRIKEGVGYRKRVGDGIPVGDEPQTVYMVTSQSGLRNGCCFQYGNGSTTAENEGPGTTEAVYFGMGVVWGTGVQGGPWVMADLENGLFAGWENGQDRGISTNLPLAHDFVTAVVVGDTADKNGGKGRFALFGGDATSGGLTTMYDGIRPERAGYVPMSKQGGVILGIGSDNSNFGEGRFYEGVIATGAAGESTLDELQAAIVAGGYGD